MGAGEFAYTVCGYELKLKANGENMKMKIVLFTLTLVLMAAGLVIAKIAETPMASVTDTNYHETVIRLFESCTVTTEGGNLNLRATSKNNSRVIAKLPNGTQVTIISRGDYISNVSVRLNRKTIRGWVSNDYLGDCGE